MQPLFDERYQPADAEIVKNKARKMMKRRTLREHQLADVEQEMALRIVQQSHHHDPKRGSREGFVGKTAQNAYLSIYEKRAAMKREDRRNISIDAAPHKTLIDGSMTEEQIDLALDMKITVSLMPPELQQISVLLMADHRKADLPDLLNLSRGKVRTLLQRIEPYLEPHFFNPQSED